MQLACVIYLYWLGSNCDLDMYGFIMKRVYRITSHVLQHIQFQRIIAVSCANIYIPAYYTLAYYTFAYSNITTEYNQGHVHTYTFS